MSASLPAPDLVAFLVAVSFAAGLNVYATTATLGLLSRAGLLTLPGQLGVIDHGAVIGACLVLWAIEAVADKMPLFDVLWNLGQAFVRIPVSVLLAYAGASELGPGWQLAASAVAAVITTLAAGGKTAAHASIAPSPEPVSNVALSLAEDAATVALVWFATTYPWLAALVVLGAIVTIVVFIRTVIRVVRRAFARATSRGASR